MFISTPPTDLKVYIDIDEGIARLGGNSDFYKRILAKAVDMPAYAALKEALAAGDLKTAELHAHTIKGVAGNLSMVKLFKLSTEYDALLKTEKTSAELESQIDDAFFITNGYVKWLLENLK